MQEHVAPLPVAVDPLIAEAKRRRRRRWLLVATAIVAATFAAVGVNRALQTPSHRLTTPPVRRLGIAGIPGMKMIASDHSSDLCVDFYLSKLPRKKPAPSMGRCVDNFFAPGVSVGKMLDQVWVRRSAVKAIGERQLRRDAFGPPALRYYRTRYALAGALPLPAALTRQHPGPMEVQVRVRTAEAWNPRLGKLGWAGSARAAKDLLHNGLVGGKAGLPARFIPLPTWTINGGRAGQFNTPWNGGMTRFQFAWAAGPRVVLVDVLGRDLTVRQAQRVAALAGPSSG